MPIQHSPPARQTRSQPELKLGPILERAAPSRKEGRVAKRSSSFSEVVGVFPETSRTIFRGPEEDGEEEEENSAEEEDSDGTEGVPAPVGASQGTVRFYYETDDNITINQPYYVCTYEI
ncbi:hypothetical protein O181_103391 [Austropuccinia psidii MF-1]|uniref:Uncharacterized protein n=1 Tax=Austropuccinia psidii MF-1 TaxID=1389203 RepID=A0A9Q3PKH0_9BASI|nr:hypothetical protein [Austropuccinia psidii MF-1]